MGSSKRYFWLPALMLASWISTTATAQDRTALIIANFDYGDHQLSLVRAEAAIVGEALRREAFRVTLAERDNHPAGLAAVEAAETGAKKWQTPLWRRSSLLRWNKGGKAIIIASDRNQEKKSFLMPDDCLSAGWMPSTVTTCVPATEGQDRTLGEHSPLLTCFGFRHSQFRI